MDLCVHCEAALARNDSACVQCGLPATRSESNHCAACLAKPPPFALTIAPFLYQPPLSTLVNGLKNGNALMEARIFASLVGDAIVDAYGAAPLPDIIFPIPLTFRRRIQRGFNQSALLARQLGKRLNIRVDYRTLQRVRHTPPQRTLSGKRRRANLKGAFQARTTPGVCVALIDDVMTTGTTVEHAARAILKAGASAVHVWVTARTPPDTLSRP